MIDYSKWGSANAPAASSTPGTTAPIVPTTPGTGPTGLAGLGASTAGAAAPAATFQTGSANGYQQPTQAQVDAMNPGERVAQGIDNLGQFLFGQHESHPNLNSIPLLGDAVGAAGNAIHAVGDFTVVKPIEIGTNALASIPLGGLPGAADDTFNQIGAQIKDNPAYAEAYHQWQLVKAAADGDVLHGGNLRGDFNSEFLKMQDDMQHDSILGTTPDLAIGKGEVGSVGGAVALAINSFLGVASNTSQRVLGGLGAFDPGAGSGHSYDQMKAVWDGSNPEGLDQSRHVINVPDEAKKAFEDLKAGKITEDQAKATIAGLGGRSRIDEVIGRYNSGLEVSDVEKKAAEAVLSGAWSPDHGADYIVSHGQGITRNPVGQVLGTALTDPLTYATLGAGSISKAGAEGIRIAEAAGGGLETAAKGASVAERLAVRAANSSRLGELAAATSNPWEKAALRVAQVQTGQMGPAFRIARGLFDPLAVYKPNTVARATQDLLSGTAMNSLERAAGPIAVKDGRALAREAEMGVEFDSAMASYGVDKANEMVTMEAQQRLLQEGLGEEMLTGAFTPDSIAMPLAQNAGRDGGDRLVDHMQAVMKNTFTADEEVALPARLASTFGKDISFWKAKMASAGHELKSFLHAMTYKRSEVEFEQAKAAIDRTAYTGTLPLDRAVLMSSETMDDVIAKQVSADITAALAEKSGGIEKATTIWNTQARKYSAMSSIGYAKGGEAQVKVLVKELDKRLEEGGITRRAMPDELNDPNLRPIRDFLDRHSAEPPRPVPEGFTTNPHAAASGTTSTLPRDGLFHITTAKDAVLKDGFKTGGAVEGFGSKGDVINAGRVSILTNRARAATYLDRIQLASKAARGEVGAAEVEAYFKPLFEKAYGDKAEAIFKDVAFEAKTPEQVYQLVKNLDGALIGGRGELGDAEAAVKLTAPFESAKGWDPNQIAMLELASKDRAVAQAGLDTGELTLQPGDLVPLKVGGATAEPTGALWRVGFRPEEEVAWGLKRAPGTGRVVYDRTPTISHVVDAVPGRQKFSDTTRNFLGQIIGPSKAERLNAPIDSAEAYLTTIRDGITGQRLVKNIEQRFERSTFEAGMPKEMSSAIMAKAKDVAGLDSTTLRGIQPKNLWNEIAASDLIPRDFVLTSGKHAGEHLNIHIVMDHLLQAAEGDMRIMGLTSQFSQRVRTWLHAHGDTSNWSGQMTVTMYNKLRYSQPMFLIQRITDAPYYSILYGVTPVGRALKGAKADLQVILDNIGRTGLARHFSMDMPEYATRSNFTKGIKSAMQQAGLKDHVLDRIHSAPDDIIAANMTNMMHARLGDIVKGVLDNLGTAAEKADPEFAAEMLRAGDELRNSFGDWRRVYSESAGRVLDDNEVGMRYLQDQLNAWRRHVVNADGTLNFDGLLHEGTLMTPSDIGQIASFEPDRLARMIGSGYADRDALRADVVGTAKKVNGTFQLVPGEHDLPWLEQQLRDKLHAHPDTTQRVMAYFSGDWDSFWYGLSKPVEKGGLDISSHYAKEAQNLIAMQARERGMDPWEYLSGVMSTNLGTTSLNDHMAKLVAFLKAGKADQPIEAWSDLFRAHLDPSAQQTLLQQFESENNVIATLATKKSMKQVMAKDFPEVIRQRMVSGVAHPNPEVEGYIQGFAKWVKANITSGELGERTRTDLRQLVEDVPTNHAVNYNRSHALVISLLRNKIEDAQQDVFRLAEMQTQRTMLERSLNHPLFGLYPSSYMWGKVLPETVKFLAKNPYAATYVIADVQRAIAVQREYDTDFEHKMSSVDRSAGAFLADYLTPGLPWSDHSARMSPMVRDLFKGDVSKVLGDEIDTVSPYRWIKQFHQAANEIPGAIDALTPNQNPLPQLNALGAGTGGGAPTGASAPGQITGPTPAAALGPILKDDLTRLQEILLGG